MKKKFTRIVYAGKMTPPCGVVVGDDWGDIVLPDDIFWTRGKKDNWDPEEYPPRKVRITFEWL
jgi:hypothetical protein